MKKSCDGLTIREVKKIEREAEALRKELVEEYGINDRAGKAILDTGMRARVTELSIETIIKRQGYQLQDRFGAWKPHPLLPALRDARSQFLMAMKQLNFDIEPLKDMGRPPGR